MFDLLNNSKHIKLFFFERNIQVYISALRSGWVDLDLGAPLSPALLSFLLKGIW